MWHECPICGNKTKDRFEICYKCELKKRAFELSIKDSIKCGKYGGFLQLPHIEVV